MSLTNDKRTLYVGGLEESVTLDVLRAAFVPFGELVDVNLPTDPSGQKHRGFAFVQYEEQGDADGGEQAEEKLRQQPEQRHAWWPDECQRHEEHERKRHREAPQQLRRDLLPIGRRVRVGYVRVVQLRPYVPLKRRCVVEVHSDDPYDDC